MRGKCYWPVGQAGRAPDGEREYRSVELGLLLRPKFYEEGWIIACRAKRTDKDIPVGRAVTQELRKAKAGQRRAEEREREEREARLAAQEQVAELLRQLAAKG